jgi:hypothetical protein
MGLCAANRKFFFEMNKNSAKAWHMKRGLNPPQGTVADYGFSQVQLLGLPQPHPHHQGNPSRAVTQQASSSPGRPQGR